MGIAKRVAATGLALLLLASTSLSAPSSALAEETSDSTSSEIQQRFQSVLDELEAIEDADLAVDTAEASSSDLSTGEAAFISEGDIAESGSSSEGDEAYSALATTNVTVSFTNQYSMARSMLSMINSLRSSVGASSLKWNSDLELVAQKRAAEISLYFSHTRPNGTSWSTISSLVHGENLAAGQTSAAQAFEAWKNSSGHYENMVRSDFQSVGMACAYVNGNYYWVQVFSYYSLSSGEGNIGNSTSVSVNTGIQYQFNGSDRYKTATAMAEQYASPGSVVIASGESYPDALSASSLAGALDNGNGVPILLTNRASLNSDVRAYLQSRNTITDVYIVGGTSSVSTSVQNELVSMYGADGVHRISGDDRYKTSVALAKYLGDEIYGGYRLPTVFVASGQNYADALSASPLAFSLKMPILLVGSSSSSSQAALDYISAYGDYVVIVGGEGSVSQSIMSRCAGFVGSDNTVRFYGDDRYETSATMAFVTVGVDSETYSWENISFATGTNYPDALAGASFCGYTGSPLVLIDEGQYTPFAVVLLYDGDDRSYVDVLYYLGGDNSITSRTRQQIRNVLFWAFTDIPLYTWF